MVTPVKIDNLEKLLVEMAYDKKESAFLMDGFRNGFDIGYRGETKLKKHAPNLKLRMGNRTILWNKIMKEVKLKRFAGPYKDIPFEFYVQSLVSLVPKDNDETRLIFHLSYPRNGSSINSETPKHMTSVKYCDFNDVIKECMRAGRFCKISKSDMKSTFRYLGIRKNQWFLLILMAVSPFDNQVYFFVDKCLLFGAAISCSHFQ